MLHKYFDINREGFSIRCKLYSNGQRGIKQAVLFGHGFGGHMDNKAAERFAGKALAKYKQAAVVTFNWPGHGNDARGNLLLSDCDAYLRLVLDWLRDTNGLSAETIYAYATSFGAYLFLKYMAEHGNPFRKACFRCPAIPLYEVFTHSIMKAEDLEKLEKGKPVMAGFDRKVRITKDFVESIRDADVTKQDYLDMADDILIVRFIRFKSPEA